MSFEDLAERLSHHESASQKRYETLHHAIKESRGSEMADVPHIKNYVEPVINPLGAMGYGGLGGAGAGAGAGLGAGLLGGILGGALLGGRGLFGADGRVGGEGCVTPTQLTAALAGVQDTQMNTNVLTQLAAISAQIPAAEGQVQLALSQTQGQLSNQIGQQSLAIAQGFGNAAQQTSAAQASIIAVSETVKDAINLSSGALQLAIANNTAQGLQNTNQIVSAVRDDGDKTRALIVAQNEATLRNEITALQIRLQEQQATATARGTEVNVTQQVNQVQAQAQAQQQQQQQLILLNTIAGHLVGLQNAVATNSNMIIGNTGATTTGAQSANPINVAR
jgi:hypothetical protein